MTSPDLLSLYAYAQWANNRVLSAAEGLAPALPFREVGHSFGSIHGTMVHVLSSEDLWLGRWQGTSPAARAVSVETCPDLAALRAAWDGVSGRMWAFLRSLSDSDWGRAVAYTTLDGRAASYPLWQLYLQVVNHGTHHRAEAASMLTELGHPPEPLDLIFFYREAQAA